MNNINTSIDKYLQGESTIAEEQAIASYLQSADVADEHRDLIPLFSFFAAERGQISSTDIKSTLDKADAAEDSAPRAKVLSFTKYLRSAAAVFALMIGAYFTFQYVGLSPDSSDKYASVEVEDPEEALEVTLEALAFLSKKLDKNTQNVRSDMRHADSEKILN